MTALNNYLNFGNVTQNFSGVCIEYIQPEKVGCSALIIAPMPATLPANSDIVANKVYRFNSLATAESLIGSKNIAYSALKTAFCSCITGAVNTHIVLVPVTATAVAQVVSFETSAIVTTHYKSISLGGIVKDVLFTAGMTAAAAAGAIVAAFTSVVDFPHNIAAATNVVTLTARDKGFYDGYFNFSYSDSRKAPTLIDSPLTNYQVVTAGAGGFITSGLSASLGQCCFACTSLISPELVTMKEVRDIYLTRGGNCFGANCFGNLYFAIKDNSTALEIFGQQGDAGRPWNAKGIVILGLINTSIYSPYHDAVARSIISCCKACDDPLNPVLNSDSVMSCLPEKSDCYSSITNEDYALMWNAGITPITTINGYHGVTRERFSYRINDNGGVINTPMTPVDYRWAAKYLDLVDKFIIDTFGSAYVFKGSTPIIRGSAYTDILPKAMLRNNSYNMNEVRAIWKDFHVSLVGILFDEQEFDGKLFALLDDQLKAACAGDATTLVLLAEELLRGRSINRVRAAITTTSSSC
jgi:hypothetical protein